MEVKMFKSKEKYRGFVEKKNEMVRKVYEEKMERACKFQALRFHFAALQQLLLLYAAHHQETAIAGPQRQQSGSMLSFSCSSRVVPSNPPPTAPTADGLLSLNPLEAWNDDREAQLLHHLQLLTVATLRRVLLTLYLLFRHLLEVLERQVDRNCRFFSRKERRRCRKVVATRITQKVQEYLEGERLRILRRLSKLLKLVEKDWMDIKTSSSDVVLKEIIKRKEILLDLSGTRAPEANRRKSQAWKEVQDALLFQCKKLLTVDQIKRLWRNRKAHVREVILKEKRYRSCTGGGADFALEKSISAAVSSLSEGERLLARTLGREAVMAGLGKMETYVDRGKASAYLEEGQGGWKKKDLKSNALKRQYCESDIFGEDSVGERTEGQRKEEDDGWVGRDFSSLETTRVDDEEKRTRRSSGSRSIFSSDTEGPEGREWREGGRAANRKRGGGREGRDAPAYVNKRKRNSESVSPLSDLSSEGWKHTRRDGGRADLQEEEGGRVGGRKRSPPLIPREELAEIRKRRIMQQLEDFDSDCSSSPQHRNSASTKQVTKLQMELLKEERAIFTKVSIAMDKLLTVLDRQLELSNALFERIRGSDNAVALQTKPSWDPVEGDPNLALSEASKSLHH